MRSIVKSGQGNSLDSRESEDRELDRLIERRHQSIGEEDSHEEDVFIEMTRREREKTRQRNRWEWVRYFENMAEAMRRRAADYDDRARKLEHNGQSEQ